MDRPSRTSLRPLCAASEVLKGSLRCPYDHYLSQDKLDDMLSGWTRRPRNTVLDNIIRLRPEGTSITIQSTVRNGIDHYLQGYFGQVDGCDESLCIKLFDERCFAISENAILGGSV